MSFDLIRTRDCVIVSYTGYIFYCYHLQMEGKLSLLASYDDIMRKSRVLKAGDEAGLKI